MFRRWRSDAAVVIALLLVWALLWMATVPLGDFPLNDDWTYGLAVKSILDTGRLSLLPWSSANAFVQVYWGVLFCKLFGFSYETLRVSTAVLGAVGVGATYGILRELRAGVAVAALGALTVGCNPLYLSQSVTFMTDVPFVALVTVSLWLYGVGIRRERWPAGWAAYAVGLAAVLIRQFAVVLPVAFAAAAVRRRRLSVGLALLLAGSFVLFVALHLGFQQWMIATQRTTGFESPASALLHPDMATVGKRLRSSLLPVIGLLGMGLLPFAIVEPGRFWPGGRRVWAWSVTLGVAAALLAVLYLRHEIPPLMDNVMQPFGIGPLALSDTFFMKSRQPELPGAAGFWFVVSAGACWGAAIGVMATVSLAVAVLRGRREGSEPQGQAALLLGFIAAYGGAMLAFVAIAPLFDRYFIVLLAPVIAVIAAAGRQAERPVAGLVLGGLLVAAMAAFSVLGTHDWLAWQRSRWQAVRLLEASSIPATKIDGGYEFNGLTTYRPIEAHQGKAGWWVVDDEYVVAGGPKEGYREIASFPVDTWLWRDGVRIVVLQRND